jgi:hypothetical protein
LTYKVGVFAIVAFLASLARGSQHVAEASFIYTHDPEGVIIPANRGRRYFRSGKTYFTPSLEDIKTLETELPSYFVALASSQREPRITSELLAAIGKYRRQYVGYHERGAKMIWVHATCMDELPWRTRPFVVTDGGTCFWTVRFSISTKRFAQLEFAGES